MHKIAILNCNEDRPDLEPQFPNDGVKYHRFFKPFFPDSEFSIFRTIDGELPAQVEDFNAYFITGSKYSAYDDFPWIRALEKFIQAINQKRIPLVGICFGHQVVSKALGGRVEKSENGWGLGVSEVQFPATLPWLSDTPKSLNIAHIHQDQVTELPPNTQVISGDDFCPHSCLIIDDHILTIQGHPEFSNEYMNALLPVVQDRFSEATYNEAMETLKHNQNEGVIFARWIQQFINQKHLKSA